MSIDRQHPPAARRCALAAFVLVIVAFCLPTASAQAASAERKVELRLSDLGVDYPLRLRTTFGQASVPLNLRASELVTSAELELRIAHSPSLRFDLSHLTVLVNNQVVWTRPLDAAGASGQVFRIPLETLLLVDRNQIRFELVAHYAKEGECEDPTHSTLWADISNDSRLYLTLRNLDLPPTLERMPAPWFDAAERGRLTLPFVFATEPSLESVRAAGIVAAWFGAQAEYRGADFPVHYGPGTTGHAVLFQLGGTSSELRAARNPIDPNGRLLIFSAPDETALVELAQAFALGHIVMRGDAATLTALGLPAKQEAWRSSRWPDLRQPLPLQRYLISPSSVAGLAPGPVTWELTLPPDLYFLGRSGASIDLGYRASRASNPKSALNLLINGEYLGSTLLNAKGGIVSDTDTRQLEVEVAPDLLRGRNRLAAQFEFVRDTSKACEDFRPATLQGSIDPRSTLQLARHTHFAEMPALEKLVNGGFPFSRFGDLSQTVVALPQVPAANEVSAALIALGHIGRWTQDAATFVDVVPLEALAQPSDHDILLIAAAEEPTLPTAFEQAGALQLHRDGAALRTASALAIVQARIEGRQLRDAEDYAARVLVRSGASLGSLQQFESPLSRGRSVVAIRTNGETNPRTVALALTDPGDNQFIEGGLALVTATDVSGYRVGNSYSVGSLPWWYAATRWLRLHPYLLLPIAILLALVGARVITLLLRRHAATRQSGST